MNDAEADPRHHRRTGVLCAAAGGAGPREDGGRRDDDHRSGGRLELQHDQRRVRRGPQGVRPGVRQSRCAARPAVERRHHVFAGELEARRSAELEAHSFCGEQGEGDRHASSGQRPAHHRDQVGFGRVLMRLVLGGCAVLVAALYGCRPTAPPHSGFTLLFLDRSPAASRAPYYVPQLSTPEPDSAPLIRMLDTLGRPIGRLATIRRPATPLLDYVVNAGAVAVGPDGAVYYAPLVRDEISKYTLAGQLTWTAKRGLFPAGSEPDPEFLPAKGADLRLKKALVNVALALGPPPGGRLYALGSDDSAATRLRVDVLDPATGAILATRHLGARETAVAVDASGVLAVFDADSLVARADGAAPSTREAFGPALELPDLAGDTVRLAGFRGKVTLVNFWASWCDPCREEFPHMAELYREFDRKDFEIAGVSDDVDSGPMLAFVRKYRPPFPILVGGGRMKQLYHYRGLPYSVLLDRQGRVIERIFGFGGAEEFRRLRQTIANEVRAP